MWIFLNDSFVSIVAHRTKPDSLLVRGRIAGDIERLFPDAKVEFNDHADYYYRAVLPRERVEKVIAKNIKNINYDNFKSSVDEDFRHEAYMKVWNVMWQTQESERTY